MTQYEDKVMKELGEEIGALQGGLFDQEYYKQVESFILSALREQQNQHELLVQAEIELSRLKEQHELEIQSYITVLNQKDAEREDYAQQRYNEGCIDSNPNVARIVEEALQKQREEILSELPKEREVPKNDLQLILITEAGNQAIKDCIASVRGER